MTDNTPEKTPEQIAHDFVEGAISKKKRRTIPYRVRLRRHFFAGLLVLTPLTLTIWILLWLINLVDGNTRDFLNRFITYFLPGAASEDSYIPIGFGLAIVFLATCFIGMLARNFVGKRVLHLVETVIRSVPGVSWIYNITHQVSHAFLNRNKDIFRRPVYLEYPRHGIFSIGFVTNDEVPGIRTKEGRAIASVFVPTTPNPTSGYLILAPIDECVDCDMNVEEAMKLIISAGVVIPDSLTARMTELPLRGLTQDDVG